MSEEHAGPSAAASRFVAGVYNYCDAWCARCRFQTRCRVFFDRQRYEALAAGLPPPPEPEEDSEPRGDWSGLFDALNREPTEDEIKEIAETMEEQDRVDKRLARDPLVISAVEYSEIVMGISAGLDPTVQSAGDVVIEAALDTIGRLGVAVGVKVRRASRGRFTADCDDDLEMEDANRTAKLVRVMIRESRAAWQALMTPGHAIGDGVPARMIARLDALDESMAARFPSAMDAVRPGLDE